MSTPQPPQSPQPVTDPGTPNPPQGTITVRTPTPEPPARESRFTATDIEKARQEEKEKLYGRLTKADERVAAVEAELEKIRQEREAAAKAEADQAAAAVEEEKRKREAEMSARKLLEERSTEWEERFAQIQREREQERAALAKEAEFSKLRAYVQERVGAERENIAPELVDLVSGNSPEEVDASIETLKAKTQAILDSVTQAQQTQRSQMRGVAPTGYTGNGPTDNESGYRQLTPEQIKDMPMSEFAKYRTQLLGKAAHGNNRGLFD